MLGIPCQGPYVLGLGLTTFLCSKEIYVMEHEYYTGISILLMVVYAVKKFGPVIGQTLDKRIEVHFLCVFGALLAYTVFDGS
ncbi:ATP synthase subunit b, mitochondrial [Portunus trituberculatus]|uniref:ATP synthase subunit b n=1 Tax=Portunus trituberculatus TaxID=210409 RepID=A0A5B7EUQ1_PORTR|nr:ATP synthase subunit b, mitochondrial [Portunus trituberculatus]